MTQIVTLTMNPAVDLSASAPKVVPTQKLRCRRPMREPGGGGINVARVVTALGGQARAVYPAGGATGAMLCELLNETGIPSVKIPIAETTRESFAVHDETSGEQYRFVFPGPELSREEALRCLDTLAGLVPRPDYVIASGSLPPGVPDHFYAEAARAVRHMGAKLVVDTSGPALARSVEEHVYLIKPNLRELKELVHADLESPDAWIEAARSLVKERAIEVVALTLGHRGALLVTRDHVVRAHPAEIKVVSGIGAGDSFLGAMIWRLASCDDLVDAFRYGVAAGSAALLTPGTRLCQRADVESLYPDVKLDIL